MIKKSNTFYNKSFLRSVNITFYDQLAHLDELDLLFGDRLHLPFFFWNFLLENLKKIYFLKRLI